MYFVFPYFADPIGLMSGSRTSVRNAYGLGFAFGTDAAGYTASAGAWAEPASYGLGLNYPY